MTEPRKPSLTLIIDFGDEDQFPIAENFIEKYLQLAMENDIDGVNSVIEIHHNGTKSIWHSPGKQ